MYTYITTRPNEVNTNLKREELLTSILNTKAIDLNVIKDEVIRLSKVMAMDSYMSNQIDDAYDSFMNLEEDDKLDNDKFPFWQPLEYLELKEMQDLVYSNFHYNIHTFSQLLKLLNLDINFTNN